MSYNLETGFQQVESSKLLWNYLGKLADEMTYTFLNSIGKAQPVLTYWYCLRNCRQISIFLLKHGIVVGISAERKNLAKRPATVANPEVCPICLWN